MVGWSEVTSGPTLQKVYPWSTLSPDTTIVDVGGGNGHAMLEIIRQFPRFKAVIQDTEGAAKDGEQFWSQAYPEALRENRVEFIPFNFLVDSPVEGRDIYYVKHIL
ncbi:hypothetical protein VKT23_011613 [Stygiomarasmius scandens]|uniref:O-methyltransferase C-terminal domain-containing protein n=1 Tax=Marasmiellus scandens TaxID=2682957 RepID=A0ABR1J8Q8_9AGAR